MGEAGNALLAIAGMAITLAGFSGLMLAFGSGREALSLNQNIAVRVLMMTGISGMIFAVVPVPFLIAGARADVLWGIMLALIGLHFLYFAIVVPLDLRRRPVRLRTMFVGFVTAHALAGIAMLAGAVGLAGLRGPGTFIAGVVWLVVIAAIQLLVQIFGMLTLAPEGPAKELEGARHED